MKSLNFGEFFGRLSPQNVRPDAVVGELQSVYANIDPKKPSPLDSTIVSIVMESALPKNSKPDLLRNILNFLSPSQKVTIGSSNPESAKQLQAEIGHTEEQSMVVIGRNGLERALKERLNHLKENGGTCQNNTSFVSSSLREIGVAKRLGIRTLLNLENLSEADAKRLARLGASALSRGRNWLPEPPDSVVAFKDWIKKGKKPESDDVKVQNAQGDFVIGDAANLSPEDIKKFKPETKAIVFDADNSLFGYHETELPPEILKMLQALKSSGYDLFIASNCYGSRDAELTKLAEENYLDEHGQPLFTEVVTPATVTPKGENPKKYKKPKPYMPQYIAETHGYEFSEVLFVGDQRRSDGKAAAVLGMSFVHIDKRGKGDHPAVRLHRPIDKMQRFTEGTSFFPEHLTPLGTWKELNFIKRAVRNYKWTQSKHRGKA